MAARFPLLILIACQATAARALVQAADCTGTADACALHVPADDVFDSIELLQVQRGLIATREKAVPDPDLSSRPALTAAGHAERPLDGAGQETSSEANSAAESVAGWISNVGHAVAAAVENASVAAPDSDRSSSEASAAVASIAGWIANASSAIASAANSTGAVAQNSNNPNANFAESVPDEGQVVVAGWIADAGGALAAALQNASVAAHEPDGPSSETNSAADSIAGWMANISRVVAGAAEIVGARAHDKDVADFGNELGIENLGDILGNVSSTVASAVADPDIVGNVSKTVASAVANLQAQLEVAAGNANKTMTIAAARLVMHMGSAKKDAADRLVNGLLAARKKVANLLAQIDQDGDIEAELSAQLLPSIAVIEMLLMAAADLMGSSADELRSSSTNSMAQREALVQRAPEPATVASARIALRDVDTAVVMTAAFASSMGSAVEDTQTLIEGLRTADGDNNWPHEGAKELQDGLVDATLKVSRLLTVDFVAEEVARLREAKQTAGESHSSLQTVLLILGSLAFVCFAVWVAARPS